MDDWPILIEVDTANGDFVVPEREFKIKVMIDRWIEQYSVHGLPAIVARLVSQIRHELIQMGRMQAMSAVPGCQGFLVEFAVENSPAICADESHVGVHGRKILVDVLRPVAVPFDFHCHDLCLGAMARRKSSDK